MEAGIKELREQLQEKLAGRFEDCLQGQECKKVWEGLQHLQKAQRKRRKFDGWAGAALEF